MDNFQESQGFQHSNFSEKYRFTVHKARRLAADRGDGFLRHSQARSVDCKPALGFAYAQARIDRLDLCQSLTRLLEEKTRFGSLCTLSG